MRKIFKASSTQETRGFYEGLSKGENKRGIWGKESRFDPESISVKTSVLRHFVPVVSRFIGPGDYCLDLGCGPGGFLTLIAPLCASITGVDVVPSFVNECDEIIKKRGIVNATTVLLQEDLLPFADGHFDRVIMVDTIHHLERREQTMDEVARVLKRDGLLLIFEPNKLNPLLALMCALDKNEHGLLRLGTFAAYRKLLGTRFVIEAEQYNGMLVGPEGAASVAIADFVSGPGRTAFGWLSPKLFIAARKV